MARKLVSKTGMGEIFSADDFFIDLAGRFRIFCFAHIVHHCYFLSLKPSSHGNCRYKFQPGLLGEAHSENQRKVCLKTK